MGERLLAICHQEVVEVWVGIGQRQGGGFRIVGDHILSRPEADGAPEEGFQFAGRPARMRQNGSGGPEFLPVRWPAIRTTAVTQNSN